MLIAALASVVVFTALSQTAASPEVALAADLKYGETRVELLDQHGQRQKATLIGVDADAVRLRTKTGTVTIPMKDVQLTTRRGDSPWDGAAIGLGVGALFTWAVLKQHDPPSFVYDRSSSRSFREDAEGALALTCLSTAVGFLIDLFHVGKHHIVARKTF